MSNSKSSQIQSVRKRIKPLIDIDDEEDNQRRDSSGRKRVDVVGCLIDSSSDENDDTNISKQNFNKILWLTFGEICHIRSVLAQTNQNNPILNSEKQYSKIFQSDLCFRCQIPIHSLFFIPSFLYPMNSSICYVCQQKICKNCSILNFLPPSSKHSFPVRIQSLIKSSSTRMENPTNPTNELNPNAKTICYDCSKIFDQYRKHSEYLIKPTDTERSLSFMSFTLPFNLFHSRQDSQTTIPVDNSNPLNTRF